MSDKVSVVIPTYNRADTIQDAVMSVVNQSYRNLEIIIFDDGSTDQTEEIIKRIGDERIKYYKGENGGAGSARNRGVQLATGDYIAFHDSDDLCRPYRIQHQLEFLKKTNSDMVYAQLERHSLDDKNQINIFPESGGIGRTKEETYQNFITRSSVWTQVVFCKAKCCKDVRFDESLPAMEDWEWSLRIAKKYKVHWRREVVVDSYISENSISRSSYHKLLTLRKMYKIYVQDIHKYNIEEYWNYLIAYYIYNDNPGTHGKYGKAAVLLGIKEKDFKKVITGILYIFYFKPFKVFVKKIKSKGYPYILRQ